MEAIISFGYWIRRQRKALDLTQQVLAERVGCSLAAIKKIESDERRPSRQIAERLADVLIVPGSQRETFLEVARGLHPVGQLLLAHEPAVPSLPSGTVTFLYTDIEGSTKLARRYQNVWEVLMKRHHAILRANIEMHHGYVFQVVGDAFWAAFPTAADAVRAAVKAQMELDAENWGEAPIRVRMGIHTGKAEVQQDGLYSGFITLSHVQRLMSVAHGGQVLLSFTVQELVQDELPEDVQLRDMGRRQLKDWSRPEHIFQLVISSLRADFPPLSTPESFPHNLPVQLTSFIGRERELAEGKQLLSNTRLFTLTGPGGTGKTRLALQLGQELLTSFADGVWLVELAPLTDDSLIPQTIASIFGLRELPSLPIINIITDYLRAKQLLLILDNCEHLVEACAQLTDHLLRSCPQLKMIVTSREALDIAGETAYRVPSLSLPDQAQVTHEAVMGFESVQLLVERASARNPKFNLTEENASDVAQICRRLDGIPLAIELAAARIKVISVDEIAARLDDRFSLLTAGSRTAIPRHQTLRATIDWSYDLLVEPERILFRRLSVFTGGFTLEAAEAVGAFGELKQNDVLDLLGRLVDKSLVIVESTPVLDETRYRLLETIREYGREKLKEIEETEKVHDQHLAYYVRLAQDSEPHIFGEQTARWFTRLDQELDNIRLAIDWSIQCHKITEVFLLLGSLDYFFFVHGPISEWQERLHRALSMPGGQEPTLARAKALNGVGMLHWADINSLEGYPDLQEALEIALKLGDKEIAASALRNLGLFEHLRGNLSKARALLEQSLDAWLELGPSFMFQKSWTLNFLGDMAFSQGDLDQALLFFEESTAILREFKDKAFLAYAVRRLAQLAIHRGNPAKAILLCRESLLLNIQVNDPRGILACVSVFAAIQLSLGRFASAVQLFAAVQNLLSQRALFWLLQIDQMEYESNLAPLKTKLDEKTLARFWSKGKAMTMEEAIEYASATENESEDSPHRKDGLRPSSDT
jgi:predicted ATPase/class 3 adenylate cyclase